MRTHSRLLSLVLLLASVLLASSAAAQSTIRHPGDRIPYRFELEPHLLWGPFDPPGWGAGDGLGTGLRASIEVAPRGFIRTINNSVAITFGFDWLHYYGVDRTYGRCTRYVAGPDGRVCVEVDGNQNYRDYFYFPVAMQWNFWLARRWSVFGEPGIVPYVNAGQFGVTPALYVGGRFHFSRLASLTCRLGYPSFSCGVSFFF